MESILIPEDKIIRPWDLLWNDKKYSYNIHTSLMEMRFTKNTENIAHINRDEFTRFKRHVNNELQTLKKEYLSIMTELNEIKTMLQKIADGTGVEL